MFDKANKHNIVGSIRRDVAIVSIYWNTPDATQTPVSPYASPDCVLALANVFRLRTVQYLFTLFVVNFLEFVFQKVFENIFAQENTS